MNICALILAAGKSSRFKSKIPKQFHFYKNELLINHSIKKLSQFKDIKKLYIAVNPMEFKKYQHLIKKNNKIVFYNGGKERRDSVLKGVNKINSKCTHILIHDAARPNFSDKLIKNLIKNLKRNSCVVPGIEATDTTIFKKTIIDRQKIKLLQTPQAFNFKDLKKLHSNNKDNKITDDTSLYFKNNLPVKIIRGEIENTKITFANDIGKEKFFGIGYDIHKMSPGYKLYIGGILIPSDQGSVGHSDGDSLLHALIDSFLGAAKLGDIGTLFPNNKKYLGIRSDKLLIEVMKNLNLMNLKVVSIDLNIILQKPNLKKYKEKIKNNISKLCKLDKKFINIKAKTTDKIGIIGKSQALACEVISTLENVK